MYSEKTFKNYIFWIQVKRVVLILLISAIGAAIGLLASELCESILRSNQYNVYIIVGSTIFMFLLSLLLTTNTGKEVQDGYWKIAVLRKLTSIQKLIEENNSICLKDGKTNKEELNKIIDISVKKLKEDTEYEEDEEIKEESEEKVLEENKKEEINNKEQKNNKKRKITKVKEVV